MKLNIPAILADAVLTLAITFSWMSVVLFRPALEPLLWEALTMSVCLLPLIWLRTAVARFVALVALMLALTCAWFVQFGAAVATVGLIGFSIFLVRRIRAVDFLQDDFAQFRTLIWDLGIMVIGLFVAYTSSDGSTASTTQNNILESGFVVATGLRLAALRSSQIARAARDGTELISTLTRPILIMVGVLIVGFGLLYWFPNLLMYLFFGGLVVGGFFAYRDKRTISETLQILVFFTVAFLFLMATRRQAKQLAKHHHKLVDPYASLLHFQSDFWYLLALILLAVLFIALYVVQRRRVKRRTDKWQPIPIILHTPMNDGSLHWHRGGSLLAQLLVNWLQWEHKRGHVLRRGETVRGFLRRLHDGDLVDMDSGSDGEPSAIETLVTRYEAERYGLRSAREEEVSTLAKQMKSKVAHGSRAGKRGIGFRGP